MKKRNGYEDKQKLELFDEMMGYSDEYIQNELIPSTLKKMQNFLVLNGHAEKFSDIKKKCRIEIKGVDPNGLERMIGKEIREKYGLCIEEANEKFDTFYPIFNEGVIKYGSIQGNHYTHFKVVNEKEKTFGLEIREYKYYHNTFYLCYNVSIKELSKRMPFYMSKTVGKDVRITFQESLLAEKGNDNFSELEKRVANSIIGSEQDAEEELSVIIATTISYLRVVNFLWENYCKKKQDGSEGNDLSDADFYDNEYFTIKNWIYNSENINDFVALSGKKIEKYIDELLKCNEGFALLKKNTIEHVIKGIIKKEKINQFYVAVGFAFKSGLCMLEDAFSSIYHGHGECNLIVGALQNYDDDRMKSKIDKTTVQYLNYLKMNRGVQLFTYRKAFYHGKFYYLCNKEHAYIIVGSSNISKTAFNSNYEMDILHIVKRGSVQDRMFLDGYIDLKNQCEKIEMLDEKEFEDYKWDSELDAFQLLKNKRISIEEVKMRIATLSDEETRFRLNLWMNYNPTTIYENMDIEALKEYTMFVFAEKELVVFESFIPQNAFYVFGCPNGVEDLVSNIVMMTKTQMTFSANYIDRGKHSSNRERLKNRINKFFCKIQLAIPKIVL